MPGRLISQRINTSSEPFSRAAARHANIVEQVFGRPLSGGRWAAALFNRGEEPRNISVPPLAMLDHLPRAVQLYQNNYMITLDLGRLYHTYVPRQ